MLFTSAKDSAYQIIYPSCPTESLKYAAEELKAYIFKISGAMLPYFQDSRHPQEKEIIVGYTNRGGYTEEEKAELGKEGFIIKTEGEKIYILGSEVRGALYGVYAFLEDYCNCRFYTNDFERVPRNTELEIADGIYNKQVPKFAYRNSYWKSVSDIGISAKLKINGCHEAPHILSLSIPGVPTQNTINILQDHGICVSAGSACAKGHRSHVLEAMKVAPEAIDGTFRISICRDTTEEELETLYTVIKEEILPRAR